LIRKDVDALKKTLKVLITIFLAVALVVCMLPGFAGADETGICFTAVDDDVLDLSVRPVFVGGSPYVPWTVFGSLGISTTYFESVNVAMLSMGSNQIMFYLDDGTCYDADGNPYPVSATSMNGTVYIPAYTGVIFGLTYSYISGVGSGDVVRIKSGANVLTDSQFIDAAKNKMSSMASAYFGTPTPVAPPTAPPTPSPTPTESEEPEKKEEEGGDVVLSFAGLPDGELLDVLKKYNVKTCFFVTAGEASEGGDILRRASGEGHILGVRCDSGDELLEGMEALQREAFLRPVICIYSENTAEAAEQNCVAMYRAGKTIGGDVTDPSVITLSLPADGKSSSFLITCGDNTAKIMSSVLSYMSANKYTPVALRETNV